MGRAQIGLGDARYQNDDAARDEFRDALDREVQLASGGAAGGSAQPLRRADRAASSRRPGSTRCSSPTRCNSSTRRWRRDRAAPGRRSTPSEPTWRSTSSSSTRFDDEARDLVGHVAQRNFGFVRDELGKIVLRADVGITEQAWEVREEELDRVRTLQSERARQEQLLDEELKEVRDDGVEPGQQSAMTAASLEQDDGDTSFDAG